MVVLSMSKQEFSRLDVLLRVQSGRLRVADACALMGLQRRQGVRLLRGLRAGRALALSIVRERYGDFGPTFAAEKLTEHHGCSISHETLRGWMIADGLWV